MSGKVLVTGGHGNLGSWIVKYLVALKYDVYVLTRGSKRLDNISYNVIECDITDIESLKKSLDFTIDYCIHCASFNEFFLPNYPKKSLIINSLGTRNLLEVLSKKNLKNFIYFSTFHVYGKSYGVIDENTDIRPQNDYACTHLFAEYYVKMYGEQGLKYTILRLTNSYGCPSFIESDKWYLVLNDLVKTAYEKSQIVIKTNGTVSRDFIWMGDVCEVVSELMSLKANNDIYNLSSGQSFKIIDLAYLVQQEYFNMHSKKLVIDINQFDKKEYHDICVKNDKLKNILTYVPKNMIRQEIKKIFNFLENNN